MAIRAEFAMLRSRQSEVFRVFPCIAEEETQGNLSKGWALPLTGLHSGIVNNVLVGAVQHREIDGVHIVRF